MLRQPAVAGAFYPEDPETLKRLIESCFLDDSGVGYIPELNSFKGREYPINVMVPHAGYQYSGAIASKGYCEIVKNGFPEVFIILSPNHTGYGSEISVFNEGEWITPLGSVEVDEEFAEGIIEFSDIASADFTAHIREHSIEVQLPFLQYFSADFKIVPITIGNQNFVTSNDLANAIFEAGNMFKLFEEVVQYNITMCGYGPVMTTISLSKRCGKTDAEILAYGTSGDVTGDFTSVVGYASGVFK